MKHIKAQKLKLGSHHIRLCQVPDVEESDQFVVASSEHNSVVAPTVIEDHPARSLLGHFEAFHYLLILQRPDNQFVLETTRGQKLVVGTEGQTQHR
jgi:hypothetical protein